MMPMMKRDEDWDGKQEAEGEESGRWKVGMKSRCRLSSDQSQPD